MIRAHQGINGRLVNNKVKTLILILHISHIHYIVSHLLHPLVLLTLPHLFNHYGRYVIPSDIVIPICIKLLLNGTIPTT